MRMKPEHVRRLTELANRGNVEPLISLIIARRAARHMCAEREHDHTYFAAQIKAAKVGLPFTASRVKELEAQRSARGKSRRKDFLAIADWLLRADDYLTIVHGLDAILDVLAVNAVHRAEAAKYAVEARGTLSGVAFVAGLEDSASTRSGRSQPDYKDGPLFNAYMRQFEQMMLDNPGAMPDPCAPGGPFYGLPTYTQRPDGTMARNAPTVTVHDSQGSRIVTGKPRTAK
ncbi:hypothetical protein [Pseudomonas putida]|uniref:hypothetical protein n=1 Tax=Pseudomonas putida TaxID=303 RepID=UPI0005B4188F|nr:hypothetical protein [Pseudomonas putida]HDS1814355.1 hypothetical protein [Pseudomonas putida]HDS3810873.1 hypothetical protein [Pseudomonas putida]